MRSTIIVRAASALLVSVIAADIAIAAEIDPAPLRTSQNPDGVTVEGGHFALNWSPAKGGDLTSIRIHDGIAWHELVGKGGRRSSVPGLLIYTAGETLGPFATGTVAVAEESPERVVVTTSSRAATEAGVTSPLEVRQTYVIHREGAVFVDLELYLPAGAPPLVVRQAAIGWPVDVGAFTLSFWHWQSTPERGSGFLDPQPNLSAPFAANVGIALGTAGNISNQLQLILESNSQIGTSGAPITTSVKDGRHFIYWLRGEGSGPLELTAPTRYRNRWGFLLGRSPARSRLAGHRIASWTEGSEIGMALPSASALAAMARCGASAVILAAGPRGEGGQEDAPAEHGPLRECVAAAHAAGLRCLATASPAGDGEALGRWVREAEFDGLYLTRASTHHGAIADPETGVDYPARATFAWGQALRRGLGPDGILITHSALEAPDLTLGLLADGVAFGTERSEWRAGRSTLAVAYAGGGGYATPCPLASGKEMQLPRNVALAAAIGAVPIVPLGLGPNRSAYVGARWVLPLWQLLRVIEPGAVDQWMPGVRAGAATSNFEFWPTVYRLGDDTVLLVTSNLSTAKWDSTAIALDRAALGLEGEFDIEVLTADSIEDFAVRFAGRSTSGRFRTDSIPKYGLRGYLFSRGERSPAVARGLDEALQVTRAFAEERPPDPASGLEVKAVTAGLELTWSPGADDQHVGGYRIYRSDDPRFRQPKESLALGEAYEETRYRDLTVSPGDTWSYVVTALDVASNESRPSSPATATLPAGERGFSFSDSLRSRRAFIAEAGAWSVHDSAYGHGCIPDGTRFARSFVAELSRADLDLGVKIWNPSGGPYAAGLICRASERGAGGYVLYLGGARSDELILGRIAGEAGDMVEPLATASYPFSSPEPQVRTLRLVARGPVLTGTCDDRIFVTATDSTYGSGRVGLVAMQGHVHFDNLTLSAPGGTGGTAPSPGRREVGGAGKSPKGGGQTSPPKPGGGTF